MPNAQSIRSNLRTFTLNGNITTQTFDKYLAKQKQYVEGFALNVANVQTSLAIPHKHHPMINALNWQLLSLNNAALHSLILRNIKQTETNNSIAKVGAVLSQPALRIEVVEKAKGGAGSPGSSGEITVIASSPIISAMLPSPSKVIPPSVAFWSSDSPASLAKPASGGAGPGFGSTEKVVTTAQIVLASPKPVESEAQTKSTVAAVAEIKPVVAAEPAAAAALPSAATPIAQPEDLDKEWAEVTGKEEDVDKAREEAEYQARLQQQKLVVNDLALAVDDSHFPKVTEAEAIIAEASS